MSKQFKIEKRGDGLYHLCEHVRKGIYTQLAEINLYGRALKHSFVTLEDAKKQIDVIKLVREQREKDMTVIEEYYYE